MRRKTAFVLALILVAATCLAVIYAHQNGVVIIKKKGKIFGWIPTARVRVNITGLENASAPYLLHVSIVNVETGEPYHVKSEGAVRDWYIMDDIYSNNTTMVILGYEDSPIETGVFRMWITAEGYTVTPESVEFQLPDYFLDALQDDERTFEVFHFAFQKAS